MLSGGTGDQNLEPLKGNGISNLAEMLSRVRALMVFSVENRGAKLNNDCAVRKAEVAMERWKTIFSKYDMKCTGIFQLDTIKTIVRNELKIAERLVTDLEIEVMFNTVDEDKNGIISVPEFLAFLQQPSRRGAQTEQDVVKSVARGVRLALKRNHINVNNLQETFYAADQSGEVATGELGPGDMIRFFRKALGLTKHESTDKALRIAFFAMDEDGSGKMSLEELMDFIKFCSQVGISAPLPERVPGLIGGMSGHLPYRIPSRRPGSLQGVPPTHLPFCLNGRDICSTGRLSQTTRGFLDRSESEPSLRSKQPNMMSRTFSPATGAQTMGDSGDDESGGRQSSPSNTFKDKPKKRYWSGQLPGKTHSGYMLLKGATSLNQVEERLFQAGIDVRGHYHRLGRGKVVT